MPAATPPPPPDRGGGGGGFIGRAPVGARRPPRRTWRRAGPLLALLAASLLAAALLAGAGRRAGGAGEGPGGRPAAAPPQLALLEAKGGESPQRPPPSLLPTPDVLRSRLPVPHRLKRFVEESRAQASAVLRGEDDRLLTIVGPCSIHDPTAAREYAHRLRDVADALQGDLLVFMRVYLEKPRTSVGWKGLVSDPELSGREDMAKGIELGRRIMLDVNAAKLPVATEFLDPLVAPFFEDLVAYGSIGARTVESPTHRALAAALPMPIGFKNPRSGDLQGAANAAVAAAAPQRRLASDGAGRLRVAEAPGNADGHIVLRGGEDGPNFHNASVVQAAALLARAGLPAAPRGVVVDCSHANSGKRHEGQLESCGSVAEQVAAGSMAVGGVMIESFLEAGNQPLDPGVTDLSDLRYGQSVTDACLDFSATEALLDRLAEAVRARREHSVLVGWSSAKASQ